MSDPTSVPSERGVWFFTEALTLSKDPADDSVFLFSQDNQDETGQDETGQVVSADVIGTLPVLTRDKYYWDFSLASGRGEVSEDECTKAFMPSAGSFLPEL
jgi:hypothetical protein